MRESFSFLLNLVFLLLGVLVSLEREKLPTLYLEDEVWFCKMVFCE